MSSGTRAVRLAARPSVDSITLLGDHWSTALLAVTLFGARTFSEVRPRISGSPFRMRMVQPLCSRVRWRNQHSRTPLSVVVVPPRAQSVTWWISHQAAGVWQVGMMHSRSRAVMARRWAALKTRSWVSMAMMRPALLWMTRWIEPVQAACWAARQLVAASMSSRPALATETVL